MNKTSIEWVRNPDGSQGYTFNPITGCFNHVNGMCKGGNFPCYAYRLAHGRLKQRYLDNRNYARLPQNAVKPSDPFYPRFWPERLEELTPPFTPRPYRNSKPRGVFVCDMADLFGIGVPNQWTEAVLDRIMRNPCDRFYLLTKQPENLPQWSPFPDHCFVGATVCNDGMMTIALTNLANVEARVRYLSIEPLLGFISMKSHPIKGIIDWIILGAQTKPYKPPEISWVRGICQAASKAGIPVFLKNNLKPLYANENWLAPYVLRQEMPKE